MFGRLAMRRERFAVPLAAAGLLAAVFCAGIADADLKSKIDTVKQEAEALSTKIQARGDRIAVLEAETTQAEARIAELSSKLLTGEKRSNQLATELTTAKGELTESQARLRRAQGVLAARLVEIYKNGEPNYVELALSSQGFDDLQSRADYLQAIEDADARVTDRVHALNDQVVAEVDRIAGLKTDIDDHNRELVAARHEVAETRAALKGQTAELAAAKAQEADDLASIRAKISDLQSQLSSKQLGALFGNGQWAIPEYIVMCESGGNYHALNPSSGAGGAYQILPSTWRSYGGKGLPHQAPPAEQDRIAGEIWRNSGPSQWSCA
ncbi:MAG: transglycosylase family protein [Solirubrobacterales bacterium]